MNDVEKDLVARHTKLSLHNANEAETRKKLIDRILEDVLGWTDDDISYEERVSEDGTTTYADYIVRTANTSFLIEAKRIGTSFNSVPQKKKLKLSGQIMKGDTGAAINQARDYCRKKSIPFSVVTNGSTWLIFPAVRTDQVSFSESNVIVFDTLESTLGEDIEHFKSLLSRDGVIDGNLAIELLGRNTDQIDERRLNRFFRGAADRPGNPIYPLIENAVITAFSDSIVGADSELLEKCYVKNADRTKFDNKIQMHLQKSESIFSSQTKKPMRKKDSAALSDSLNSALSSSRPLAILILGTVGTGKSTFLQYTKKVAAKTYFETSKDKAYPHWIDVDFRNFSKNESPIKYLYNCLFEYLKKDIYFNEYNRAIRSAYSDDISSLKNGPMYLLAKDEERFEKEITNLIMTDYNEIDPYVDKLLAYGASKSPIFLVVDNVDQFEKESIQSEIFSDAIALAGRLNINLVMAMRESTYVNHRSSPTFDAFDFDPIHIEPPEIPAVLSRRFFMAAKILSGQPGEFTALNGAKFKAKDLSVFIDIVQSSVLGTEIGLRIDVLSNHDVRLALRMTREFLARGYTDPAKALSTFYKKGKYTLPKQEAFRSILLGNQSVYSEKYSVIGNPFDSRLGRSNGELLRLFVLSALVKHSSESGASYLDAPTIRERLNSIGFSETDTLHILSGLCELRFVHTSSHGKASLTCNYYPSRLGGHIVRDLLGNFEFIENVMMDTFISDKDVWNKLKGLTQSVADERNIVKKIKLRVIKVNVFYDYMELQYDLMLNEAAKRGLESIWLGSPFKEMRATLENNLTRATAGAQRYYGG